MTEPQPRKWWLIYDAHFNRAFTELQADIWQEEIAAGITEQAKGYDAPSGINMEPANHEVCEAIRTHARSDAKFRPAPEEIAKLILLDRSRRRIRARNARSKTDTAALFSENPEDEYVPTESITDAAARLARAKRDLPGRRQNAEQAKEKATEGLRK